MFSKSVIFLSSLFCSCQELLCFYNLSELNYVDSVSLKKVSMGQSFNLSYFDYVVLLAYKSVDFRQLIFIVVRTHICMRRGEKYACILISPTIIYRIYYLDDISKYREKLPIILFTIGTHPYRM